MCWFTMGEEFIVSQKICDLIVKVMGGRSEVYDDYPMDDDYDQEDREYEKYRQRLRNKRNLRKLKTTEMWSGITLMISICAVVLFFAYYTIFQENSQIFWMVVSCIILFLLYRGWTLVREDGAGFIGTSFG